MAPRIHHVIKVITSFFVCLMFVFVMTDHSTMWAQALASDAKKSTQVADMIRDPADVPPTNWEPCNNDGSCHAHSRGGYGPTGSHQQYNVSVLDL